MQIGRAIFSLASTNNFFLKKRVKAPFTEKSESENRIDICVKEAGNQCNRVIGTVETFSSVNGKTCESN